MGSHEIECGKLLLVMFDISLASLPWLQRNYHPDSILKPETLTPASLEEVAYIWENVSSFLDLMI